MSSITLRMYMRSGRSMGGSLQSWGDGAVDAARRQMKREGRNILAVSKAFVPILTGSLINSGRVETPTPTARQSKVLVVYGGQSTPHSVDYSVDQHENMSYRHINGGQAKYLFEPAQPFKPGMPKRVASAIQTDLLLGR